MLLRKTLLAASVTAALGLVSVNANADGYGPIDSNHNLDGFYGSVFGGIGNTPKFGDTNLVELEYKSPSWQAGGAIGYKSGPLRYEGEFLYQQAQLKNLRGQGLILPATSDTSLFAGFANIIYDFDNFGAETGLVPYLGVGIGYGQINAKITVAPFGTISGKDNGFVYQGIAGLNYNFDDNTSLFLDYRYVASSEIKGLNERYQTHTLNLGITYRFDSDLA